MNETTDDTMEATYAALCDCGYASVRTKDIAAESSKIEATLHYHYESKQELLYASLEYRYESFEVRLDAADGETPVDRLLALVETVLSPPDGDDREGPRTALLEIEAQRPYDDRFREQLERFDGLLHRRIRSLLEEGRDRGLVGNDVDPDETADFVVTAITGAQTRTVAVGYPVERAQRRLETSVADRLVTDREGVRA